MFNIGTASTVRTGVLNGRSGLRNAPLAVPACPRVGLIGDLRLYLRELQRRAWSAASFANHEGDGETQAVTDGRPIEVIFGPGEIGVQAR